MKKGQLDSHILVLVTLGLTAFGLVMVYSATSAPAALGGGDPVFYLKREAIYALIGVALLMVALADRLPGAPLPRAGADADEPRALRWRCSCSARR